MNPISATEQAIIADIKKKWATLSTEAQAEIQQHVTPFVRAHAYAFMAGLFIFGIVVGKFVV